MPGKPASSTVPLIAAFVAAQMGVMQGSGTFAALLPNFIELWNLSKTDAGWINGIYYAGYLGAVPFLVSLADRAPPGAFSMPPPYSALSPALASHSSQKGSGQPCCFACWAESALPAHTCPA